MRHSTPGVYAEPYVDRETLWGTLHLGGGARSGRTARAAGAPALGDPARECRCCPPCRAARCYAGSRHRGEPRDVGFLTRLQYGTKIMITKIALAALLGALAGTLVATGGHSVWEASESGALSTYGPKAAGRITATWQVLRRSSR